MILTAARGPLRKKSWWNQGDQLGWTASFWISMDERWTGRHTPMVLGLREHLRKTNTQNQVNVLKEIEIRVERVLRKERPPSG